MTGPRRRHRDAPAVTIDTEHGTFTRDDRVTVTDRPGDTWRIREIYPVDPPVRPEPIAGLVLIGREGGMPIGETGTAVPARMLRPVETPAGRPAAGYDGRPVILIHLQAVPGVMMAACTGQPFTLPDDRHRAVTRAFCPGCQAAKATPRPNRKVID